MRHFEHRLAALLYAAIGLIAATASAQLHFVEEFDTTTFLDAENTSAAWDTEQGVVRFPDFAATILGAVDTPSAARGVEVHGTLAYVADGYSGVQVVDITDPANPVIIGSYNTSGYAYQVEVEGHYAYVADWEHGLDILNVQYPSQPVLVANVPTANANLGLAVKGDLVYIADGGGGLRIVDVTTPYLPTLVGTAAVGAGSRVDVAGDVAYLAVSASGLLIFDVSDPTNPVQIGAYDTPGAASDVVVKGTLAYVADNDGGLQVIDVTDPANPVLHGAWVSAGETRGLTVDGDWVYLASGGLGVRVIDVTDPANPSLDRTIDLPGSSYDVATDGATLHAVTFGSGLQVIATAENWGPPSAVAHDTPGEAGDVVVSGDLAYVADGSAGFSILDVSDPENPLLRDTMDTFRDGASLDVDGDLALMLCTGGGLYSFDVADPDDISYQYGDLAFTGDDIVIDGDLAYVADLTFGLRILDLTDPGLISEIGSLPLAGTPRRLAVDGDRVYLACGPSGLAAVDVTDPTAPLYLASFTGGNSIGDVDLAGDHAFLADTTDELIVLDTTDAYVMTELARMSHGFINGSTEIVVSGNRAWVFAPFWSSLGYDITDPANPGTGGGFSIGGGELTGACVTGDHFFAAVDGELHVVRLRQRRIDSSAGTAVSLTYPTSGRNIVRYRAFTGQTGGASVHAYASCLGIDYPTPAGETWTRWPYDLCGDLGFFVWLDRHENTVVDWVDLQWLEDSSVIHTISDVPGDQGGRVYIDVVRSGYDFADEPTGQFVTQYGVWRRVDDDALARRVSEHATTDATMPGVAAAELDGSRYVTGLRGTFPDGTWALVSSIPALQQDHYLAEVPTAADSSDAGIAWSAFVVTTHTTTPSEWYVTFPDSGYSTDDLAPAVPTGFAADYQADGVDLDWDDAPEPDFDRFRVYRGTSADFEPAPGNLVAELAASAWTDPSQDPWAFHYKVAAVDHAGNVGEAAAAGGPVGVPGAANAFALGDAVPNPFNPSTTIRYAVPVDSRVELTVYDLSGHAVATLVSEHQAAGEHSVRWQGQDAAGNRVASGVYLYRLMADGFRETRRMTLVK